MEMQYLFDDMIQSDSLGNKQRRQALITFFLLTAGVLYPFSFLNILLGNVWLGVFEFTIALLSTWMRSRLIKSNDFAIHSSLFVGISGAILLAIILAFPTSESTLAWIGLFPMIAFFLLGGSRGTQAHIVFSAVLMLALLSGFHIDAYPVTRRVLFNVGGVLIATGVFVRVCEKAKKELFERIYHQSFLDELTGAGNRKLFVQLLTREKASASRHHRPLSLIMIDLDHFKHVNDQLGHIAGDHVLVAFTKAVQSSLRKSDILFRWGGEEFIVLLADTSAKQASLLAEKLRTSIEHQTFPPAGVLTASFGVAQAEPDESDEETVRRIDRALYHAKVQGRNRVEMG